MYRDVVTQIVFLVKGKLKMQLTKTNATPYHCLHHIHLPICSHKITGLLQPVTPTQNPCQPYILYKATYLAEDMVSLCV